MTLQLTEQKVFDTSVIEYISWSHSLFCQITKMFRLNK